MALYSFPGVTWNKLDNHLLFLFVFCPGLCLSDVSAKPWRSVYMQQWPVPHQHLSQQWSPACCERRTLARGGAGGGRGERGKRRGGGRGVWGWASPHHGLHSLHGNHGHADPAGEAKCWPPPALDGAHQDGEAEAGEWSAAQAGDPVPYTAPKRFHTTQHPGEG